MAFRADPTHTTVDAASAGRPGEPLAVTGTHTVVEQGDRIGRYEVRGVLGRGGMGVVFDAWDPELQRAVALKLMRRTGHEARLLQEARAVARLAHPNVVGVYDVGTHDGDVFLALERVSGPDLRAWLREPRPVDVVVDAFLQAGEGLSAAHRAGLVHGDFKPDNVLVGHDGRVRVADFGLARPAGADAEVATAGTPAYMAPEQRDGQGPSERTDQYAWCVAVIEAVTGLLPAPGDPLPVDRVEPEWLRRVAARGTSADPAARFATLEALLVAVRADQDPRRAGLRESAGRRLAGTWDDDVRARMHQAFAASGSPEAEPAWTRVEALLDARAQRWVATFTEACAATHIDGAQSVALLDHRIARLERLRHEIGALVRVLCDSPDAAVIGRAAEAVRRLTPIGEPADAASLAAEAIGGDAPHVLAVRACEGRLDEVRALFGVGRYDRASEALEGVVAEARALDHAPLLARAYHLTARIQEEAYSGARSEEAYFEAAHAATRARDEELAAECLVRLVFVVAAVKRDPARAADLARMARLAALRVPESARIEAMLANNQGVAATIGGDHARALDEYRRAIDAWERCGPDFDGERAGALQNLAIAYAETGHLDRAAQGFAAVVGIHSATFGPRHPRTARAYGNLGELLARSGRLALAEVQLRRALDVWTETLSAHNNQAFFAMFGLAEVATQRGDGALAVRWASDAVALLERWGPDQPGTGNGYVVRARARSVAGDHAGALADAEHGLAIVSRVGAEHWTTGQAWAALGAVAARAGDASRAREALVRALGILEAALGADSPELAAPLTDLGVLDDAVPLLERARALQLRSGVVGPEYARACAEVAWRTGDRALALEARERWIEAGGPAASIARVEAWLTAARRTTRGSRAVRLGGSGGSDER